MARPGVQVTVQDSVPPRSQPTDVDTWFVVGLTEKGPDTPTLVRSMGEFETAFGERVNYGTLWDPMDVYFREGGSKAYVTRVVGPAATVASATLSDADTPTVRVDAKSVGDWGENLDVAVVAGTPAGVRIQVWDDVNEVMLEQSPSFTVKADLVSWQSNYVTLVDIAPAEGLPIVTARTGLTGGDDDVDAITDASYTAALDRTVSSYGPGQISIPGDTDADRQAALLDHAAENNRIALLDADDTDVVATLTAQAAALTANVNSRYGGLFGPRATVPGILPNTTREVPYTAIQAAMISRQTNPNDPAAGRAGQSNYAISVKYDFTDADRETLNEAGVNIARNMFNGVRTYGYRTLVDPTDSPNWVQLNGSRLVMAIKAEAEAIGEEYMFKAIDGRGLMIAAFGGALTGMLIPYYDRGALYGSTAQEAFYVDTGSLVNTPETIADGQLRATIAVRTSPFGELVQIDIVKRPLPDFTGQALV